MEDEFRITVNLLSLGGNIDLTIIPTKRFFTVLLDDQELCRLHKDKELAWKDLNNEIDNFSSNIIGAEIDSYYSYPDISFRKAG